MRKQTKVQQQPEPERLAAYDHVALPADNEEKTTQWSREVVLRRCRHPSGCAEMTERVLCDTHFYRLLRLVRNRVIERHPDLLRKEQNANGA